MVVNEDQGQDNPTFEGDEVPDGPSAFEPWRKRFSLRNAELQFNYNTYVYDPNRSLEGMTVSHIRKTSVFRAI